MVLVCVLLTVLVRKQISWYIWCWRDLSLSLVRGNWVVVGESPGGERRGPARGRGGQRRVRWDIFLGHQTCPSVPPITISGLAFLRDLASPESSECWVLTEQRSRVVETGKYLLLMKTICTFLDTAFWHLQIPHDKLTGHCRSLLSLLCWFTILIFSDQRDDRWPGACNGSSQTTSIYPDLLPPAGPFNRVQEMGFNMRLLQLVMISVLRPLYTCRFVLALPLSQIRQMEPERSERSSDIPSPLPPLWHSRSPGQTSRGEEMRGGFHFILCWNPSTHC